MRTLRRRRNPQSRKAIRRRLWQDQYGVCPVCLWTMSRQKEHRDMPFYATIDHIVPLADGGMDRPPNLRLVCRRCNERKGSS